MTRLNLGSKHRKIKGFDNLDKIFGWHFQDGLPQYSDGTVDGITISHALMFLTPAELEKFIGEMWRVLQFGGVVRITEDDTENPLSDMYQTGCIESGPRSLTGPKMMRRLLEKAGFIVYDVDQTTTHFYDKSLIQAYRGGPPKRFFIEGIKGSIPPQGINYPGSSLQEETAQQNGPVLERIKLASSLTETPSLEKNPIVDASVQYGTFLPALIKVMNITAGPVLELGMGMFSTPYLHFACYPKRKLVSYESDKEYYNWLNIFKSDYHEIHFVKDWNEIDLFGHWSVVLVDHEPTRRRKEEIKRLAESADYIVVHDTNPRLEGKYKYSEIYPLFKFRKDFNREKPYTAILSNFKDLSNL